MRNGCPYVVNAADDASFARLAVRDGDELTAGAMTIRVVATAGHTDTHLSYVISEGDQSASKRPWSRRTSRPASPENHYRPATAATHPAH
jgi:hypothetical protein